MTDIRLVSKKFLIIFLNTIYVYYFIDAVVRRCSSCDPFHLPSLLLVLVLGTPRSICISSTSVSRSSWSPRALCPSRLPSSRFLTRPATLSRSSRLSLFLTASPCSCAWPFCPASQCLSGVPTIVRAALSETVQYVLHVPKAILLCTDPSFLWFLAAFSAPVHTGAAYSITDRVTCPYSLVLAFAPLMFADLVIKLSTCGENILPLLISTSRYFSLALGGYPSARHFKDRSPFSFSSY